VSPRVRWAVENERSTARYGTRVTAGRAVATHHLAPGRTGSTAFHPDDGRELIAAFDATDADDKRARPVLLTGLRPWLLCRGPNLGRGASTFDATERDPGRCGGASIFETIGGSGRATGGRDGLACGFAASRKAP